MVEHTTLEQSTSADEFVLSNGRCVAGENVNRAGIRSPGRGRLCCTPGSRLGFAEIALLAAVGAGSVRVFPRPRVAILATGDEILGIDERPPPTRSATRTRTRWPRRCARAGGCPEILPVARDVMRSTRELIERGLESDLLLLSGGVSAGKYDHRGDACWPIWARSSSSIAS